MTSKEPPKVGEIVIYKAKPYRIIGTCPGECSHRQQKGHYLHLEGVDSNWNHVDAGEAVRVIGKAVL